jgi:hypothetical protein
MARSLPTPPSGGKPKLTEKKGKQSAAEIGPSGNGYGTFTSPFAKKAILRRNPSVKNLFLLSKRLIPLWTQHNLFKGDLAGAVAMNPLMVVSLPLIGLLFLQPVRACQKWVPWFCIVTLIVYGVFRNIPAVPFTYLAPH